MTDDEADLLREIATQEENTLGKIQSVFLWFRNYFYW